MKDIIQRIRRCSVLCTMIILFSLQSLQVYAREGDENPEILAEAVMGSELAEGDRIVIVNELEETAISMTANNTSLLPGDITVSYTATRQVLTGINPTVAVFTVEKAKSGNLLLRSAGGYLTALDGGSGLMLEAEANAFSECRIIDDVYLYFPNAEYVSGGQTYRNYYLEFYDRAGIFTIYGKGKNSNLDEFKMCFFRMGNSRPEEELSVEEGYHLPVFQTSDTHGYLMTTSRDEDLYLLAYISCKVREARGNGSEYRQELALLLDGGDIYQGNPISNLLQGQSISAAYERMGYDAVTIGNHEFDWGIENTVDADGTMIDYDLEGWKGINDIPVVISNLYKNGKKVDFARDYVILEKTARNSDGDELPVRIAVIGYAGQYDSSIMYKRFTGAGYSIRQDFDQLNELARSLEESGACDATILLTHEEAEKIAESLGEGSVIDLVLGGHTHRNQRGVASGIPYLEPASYGAAYTYSELVFNVNNGKPVFEKVAVARTESVRDDLSSLVRNPDNNPELDMEIVDLTDVVFENLEGILSRKVGCITESADRKKIAAEGNERSSVNGNFTASVIRRIGDADVAFVNDGGLRLDLSIPTGSDRLDITVGHIYRMFPFDNTIYTFTLTGEELLKSLQYSLTDKGEQLLSQVTGIDVYYTDRTVRAIVLNNEVIYINGAWKDGWKNRTIRVAVSDFIATTDRISSDGMHNPFVAWSEDASKFVVAEMVDNVGAYEVLSKEAEASNGHLNVDTAPHFLNRDYTDPVSAYSHEWVKGRWYNKNGSQTYKGIGKWIRTQEGWIYKDSLGWTPVNKWQKIDGKWYFFDETGYMEKNAYRGGYYLTASGAWDSRAKAAGWKKNGIGWWYSTDAGSYLRNEWKKIDGKWYFFDETGYMEENAYRKGYYLTAGGAWDGRASVAGWKKNSTGWWYSTGAGACLKNEWKKIDGRTYVFDINGYLLQQ